MPFPFSVTGPVHIGPTGEDVGLAYLYGLVYPQNQLAGPLQVNVSRFKDGGLDPMVADIAAQNGPSTDDAPFYYLATAFQTLINCYQASFPSL